MKSVGYRLKILRKEKKYTLENLAVELNFKYNTKFTHSLISRWENSKFDISIKNLNIYSDFFDVSLDWLINGTEPKYVSIQEPLEMILTTKQQFELDNWINTNILFFNSLNLTEIDKENLIKIMKESYIRSLQNRVK
ncbi:helix-turn-helix domain-containing protein [Oceanivirga salmonicida]|uniref:helix-turn-helix domain-containing protein n=1 Tax=Oceanivirga salmonicida TaxID=1769291 RepID=UPI0012E17B26|nr:helix-turn-helix transcriptional regulator [Oceanivirga salmonicida]